MKYTNECFKKRLDQLDQRRAARREMRETLAGVFVLVFIILMLGVEDWVEVLI